MKTRLLITLVFLLCSWHSHAQQYSDIVGRVMLNGAEPVSGAEVTYILPNSSVTNTVFTGNNGYYYIYDMEIEPSSSSVRSSVEFSPLAGVTNPLGSGTSLYVMDIIPVREATIYNILGRRVRTVVLDHCLNYSSYWFSNGYWDGTGMNGNRVSAGRYFVSVQTSDSYKIIPVLYLPGASSDSRRLDTNAPMFIATLVDNLYSESNERHQITANVLIQPGENCPLFRSYHSVRSIWSGMNPQVVDTVRTVRPARILLIGNSYTYGNNGIDYHLGKMIEQAHPNWPVHTDRIAYSGHQLYQHARSRNTIDIITNGGWDYVILQDHSLEAFEYPDLMKSSVRLLCRFIEAGNATPALFMTWAREYDPSMIETVSQAYVELGELLDIPVIPVGLAWQHALETAPELDLYTQDGSHPNKSGTYLATCVFYATIYNETPEGLYQITDNALPLQEQQLLQRIAWETVQSFTR